MSKQLPLKELSIGELYNGTDKRIFQVPIYQRNYAWEKEEITALIQDAFDAFEEDKSDKSKEKIYYIGTLVTYKKEDGIYEVIDGQQRLTTIYLILKALGETPSVPLTYKARKKSNITLSNIPSFDKDDLDEGIVNGYKYAKEAIRELVKDEELSGFKDYFREKIRIIHYEVPRDVDLNHYFEIMNSRGEQLEKHEIIKARLMSYLKRDEIPYFNRVWEACSQMGVYIQSAYKEGKEDIVFNSNKEELKILKAKNFEDLVESLEASNEKNTFEAKSIKELTEGNDSQKNKPDGDDNKENFFQSIIDFPNFLLIVLKLVRIQSESEGFKAANFTLDDKELIKEFDEALKDKDKGKFAKKFCYTLLKAKYFLDNFVVHHTIEDEEEKPDKNPWDLKHAKTIRK